MSIFYDGIEYVVELLLGSFLRCLRRIVVGIMLLFLSFASNTHVFLIRVIVAIFLTYYFVVFGTWARAFGKNVYLTLINILKLYFNVQVKAYFFIVLGILPYVQEVLFAVISGRSMAAYLVTLTTNNDWNLDILQRVIGSLMALLVVVNRKLFGPFISSWLTAFSFILGIDFLMDGAYSQKIWCRFNQNTCNFADKKMVFLQLAMPLIAQIIAKYK